ncbi:MAG TPA: hypothetical protein VNE39_14785 [Planctomycetota bacterium]|nr:hypothetical protein [Planctomycetota bacterium]
MRPTFTVTATGTLSCLLALLPARAAGQDAPPAGRAAGADGPAILQSEYARWRQALPADYPQAGDYRRVLLRWVKGAEQHWEADPACPDLGKCRFGKGHPHVRTARSLPVYAALAADADNQDAEWPREKLAERINSAIAYLCATYRAEGPQEGCWARQPRPGSLRYETWVIGNMVDVLQIAPDVVTPASKKRIREILLDIVEDERTSGRARALKDYRHEGITWTMNLLARAALLYPDHPQAGEWLALAKHGYASSLSVESDRSDDTVIDGKPVKDWVARRCPVFHPDFTLTHHGLGIHPGYMGFASHRIVSLYDMLHGTGKPVSPIWHLHYRDVMGVIKGLALWDGRIAYPNGKDWADYLYGVSSARFHMVGLQMMFGDPEARLIEQGAFRNLEWLQLKRGQGDFGPSNAEYLFNANDAKNVGFAYWLRQQHAPPEPASQAEVDRAHTRVFHSPHASFVYARDPQRFASWGWRAGTGVTGLIVPRGQGLGDHLAQWDGSLAPHYWLADEAGKSRQALQRGQASRRVETFGGGFAVSEHTEFRQGSEPTSVMDQRFMVALPDGRTVLFAASGRAVRPIERLATSDINYRLVRSVFSDMRRTVYGPGGRKECLEVQDSVTPWSNIDDVLGVVSIGEPARLSCRPVAPSGNDRGHAGQTVSLSLRSLPPRDYEAGTEIFAACVAFVTDVEARQTEQLVGRYRVLDGERDVRVVRVHGLDDRQYVVALNLGDVDKEVAVPDAGAAKLLTAKSARVTGAGAKLLLPKRCCALLVR